MTPSPTDPFESSKLRRQSWALLIGFCLLAWMLWECAK